MYSREKSRKNHRNEPSFSSTLLEEIYRSIDANADNTEFFCRDDDKLVKCQVNFRSHRAEDEEMVGFRRDCLVEKWMLKEENDHLLARRGCSLVAESENKSFIDKDMLYFSSNSTSSDSSGAFSSSSPDTDLFSSSRVSCFSSVARPKPVRVGVKNRDKELDDDSLFKSKSRALKILRKMKQPISPGGKLTSFINSLFNHANEKKLKNVDSSKVEDLKSMGSSSNGSRSCLSSKNSPKSMRNNGIQRTVRFDPVSVILNEESKSMIGGRVKNKTVAQNDIMSYGFTEKSEEDDEEDAMSDSSSDLFELDHLSLFGHTRFCQELPMYETTHFNGTNRAIW